MHIKPLSTERAADSIMQRVHADKLYLASTTMDTNRGRRGVPLQIMFYLRERRLYDSACAAALTCNFGSELFGIFPFKVFQYPSPLVVGYSFLGDRTEKLK